MHQPLEALQQTGSLNGLKQSKAIAETGAVVMQMFATMARKPQWQRGKLGEPACLHGTAPYDSTQQLMQWSQALAHHLVSGLLQVI
jgi:hypothetical protein